MSDLRENLGWIIGSIATAIAMAFGWIYQSGILGTLVGIIVGAGIAFFIQTKTQKRAWKREYSVRIAEEVYGSLFSGIKGIILALERKGYWHLGFDAWRTMQDDHRYFMVEKKFRIKLDDFFKRLENYNTAISKLRGDILPEIVYQETERVFNIEPDEITRLDVKYKEKRRSISSSSDIINCLISETHPRDHALRDTSEVSDVECFVNVRQRGGTTFRSHDMNEFSKFWESCLRRTKEDKTYKFVSEENDKLLVEARNVQKEIVKRIEEPWKI